MFRAYGPGPSLWESLLPEEVLALPEELARVDELLDDPVFFEPVRPYFDPRMGRKSVPMETFLRMTYLKYRSAPRGALRYPPLSGEGLEVISLGPMAYLDSKEEGDNSMVRHEAPDRIPG